VRVHLLRIRVHYKENDLSCIVNTAVTEHVDEIEKRGSVYTKGKYCSTMHAQEGLRAMDPAGTRSARHSFPARHRAGGSLGGSAGVQIHVSPLLLFPPS
jgi:hypothetical protein